ncbi:pilus assembly FimT family protein [Vibrio atypicus]|uniref:pilus assembly FimT family protein n=1 Tax=Vibrio atypicus TaxID=558271 RepID=UPI0037362160
MMSAFKIRAVAGFTLIELLIVIVIMALSTGIVAPNLYRQYQKMTHFSELSTLEAQLRMLGQRAFYQRRAITVVLDGKQMSWVLATNKIPLKNEPLKDMHSIDFEFIFADPQTINFNADGNPDLRQVSVVVSEIEREIDVPTIY